MALHQGDNTSSGPPASGGVDGMMDLQSLLDRIHLNGTRDEPSAVDQVAENLRVRLNIRVDDEQIFHSLAAQLLNVNISSKGNEPSVGSSMGSSDTRKTAQPPDVAETELQSTWSTETSSTATSGSFERRDSPTSARQTVVTGSPLDDMRESKDSIGRGRSPVEGVKLNSQQTSNRPHQRRSPSPSFRRIFSGEEKDTAARSPANAHVPGRNAIGRSGSFVGTTSLKPPISPYPSAHNDSFGSSLPATPYTQVQPGPQQSPVSARRSFTETTGGLADEPMAENVAEANDKPVQPRGRSRSPLRFSNKAKNTPTKPRSQSVPRNLEPEKARVSPFRRRLSPGRIFASSSRKDEMKVDTSGPASNNPASANLDPPAIQVQTTTGEIPKSSPLKTPLSRMASMGAVLTGKGKLRRKMEDTEVGAAAATTPSLDPVEGGCEDHKSPLFKVDLSKPANRKQERNGNGGRKKPSVRKTQQMGGTPMHDNAYVPTEHAPSPMDTDTKLDESTLSQTPSAEFGNEVCFSLGDPGKKSNKRRPGKGNSRTQTKRNSEKSQTTPAQVPNAQTLRDQATIAMEVAQIKTLRDNALTSFEKSDYRASIRWNTKAITAFSNLRAGLLPADSLAVLLAGRAEAYLMIKAAEASVFDCKTALSQVALSQPASVLMNMDSGPVLQARLHILLARGLLLAGNAQAAAQQFDNAVRMSEHALSQSSRYQSLDEVSKVKAFLSRILADGALGKSDVSQFKQMLDKLASYNLPSLQAGRPSFEERRQFVDALGTVSTALLMAPCCLGLHERKVALLASLRRWREVASHCERLAAVALSFEGSSERDIQFRNTFHNLPAVKELSPSYFGDPKDEDFKIKDYESAEKKLNARATGEAVLRLPRTLMRTYLRSLRLEERYPAEEKAIKSLEDFISSNVLNADYDRLCREFAWLALEKQKLSQTRRGRDRGDELFNNQDHALAAAQYARCLKIDAEGEIDGGDSGGGRLHAVLHCNRAAAFMALNNFEEAVQECTAALRVHNRYMKAILRRARCYARLNRFEEAVADCERYLELVNEAKTSPHSCAAFITPCLFDGPRRVSNDDLLQVKHELAENKKKLQRKENAAREEASYRGERQRFHEAYADAHRRRENWYNQQGSSGSRRWDSFNRESGPKRSPRQKNPRQAQPNNSSSARGATQSGGTFNSIPTAGTHYGVLDIAFGASEADIKKAYRKMALKYHPDKNKDADAPEFFRRVKEAYECLNNATSRRDYDAGLRWGRRK